MQRTGRDATLVTSPRALSGGHTRERFHYVRAARRASRALLVSSGPKPALSKAEGTRSHTNSSRDGRDYTLRADDECSALGIGAYGIELHCQLFICAHALRIRRRAEVEDEVLTDEEEALRGDRFVPCLLSFGLGLGSNRLLPNCLLIDFAVVSHRGEICLRMNRGKRPCLAAVLGEGEVGPIVVGMFVVASGDHAMQRVAERDGENAGRVGTMQDGGVEDLPSFAAVGGVNDAGG